MIQRGLLIRIEDFARRHWALVFVVTAIAVVASLSTSRWLRLESDILAMIPQGDPEISTFVRTLEDFGTLDHLLVMMEAPEGTQADDYEDLVEAFATALPELEEVESVEYRLDETSPAFRLFRRNAPLYLGAEGLGNLEEALADEAIRERVARLRGMLESPGSPFLKEFIREDPLGLAPIFLKEVVGRRGALRIDLSTGYYLSPDGRSLLLVVRPSKPPQDLSFSSRLEQAVLGAWERSKLEVAEEDVPAGAWPEIELGGAHIIAIEDSKVIKADLRFNAIVSFLAVMALYLFCYRRLAAAVYSTLPLLVGQALAFAVAVLVLGGLNNVTAGFTAMLMGLGTDFTIVMYARYVEERRAGATLATATHRMMGETALGVFTGAITSAGTFAAVCVSRFPGLREFGFLVGSGILLCLVAILFLLPAMIAWNDGRRRRRGDIVRKLYIHSFGFERLINVADRYPRAVVGVCLLLTLVAAAAATRIEMSGSYRDIRPEDNRGFLVQDEIARRFGGNFKYMIAVSRGATLSEALEKNRGVVERLEPWRESERIAGIDSLLTYLPDEASQSVVIERLREGSDETLSISRIEKTFRAALDAEGFRPRAFDRPLEELRAQLGLERPLDLEVLREGKLGSLVDRFVAEVDGEFRTATYIFRAGDVWRQGPPAEFVEAVSAGDPDIALTGMNVVGVRVKELFRTDAIFALVIGMIIVAVLLQADFRSVRLTLFGLIQLNVGVIWMLGLMKLFGITMNFINAFATTMILGVGIDYGIHIIHRIWEDRSLTSSGVMSTGKAVVMAALTNVAGFGTVALSGYPGIRSMGLVCLFGTSACLVTALSLLPALMKLFPEPRMAPPPPD